MKLIFEWKKKFTSERSELLLRYERFKNGKTINEKDGKNKGMTSAISSYGYGKYVTRIPDVVSYENKCTSGVK